MAEQEQFEQSNDPSSELLNTSDSSEEIFLPGSDSELAGIESRTPAPNNGSSNPSSREITVSTLVHLLGLPTTQQMTIVENKLDILVTKLNSIGSKLDHLERQRGGEEENTVGRIEFQLTEIKSILKKSLGQGSFLGSDEKKSVAKAPVASKILTSEPPAKSKQSAADSSAAPASVADSLDQAAEGQAEDDKQPLASEEEFQRSEAMRVRNEATTEKEG